MRSMAIRWLFAVAVAIALPAGWSWMPRAVAAGDEERAAGPTLEDVAWYDGSSWHAVDLVTGAVDGPGSDGSPKARFQSRLGGPKSFFVVPGPASDVEIREARPRFRVKADGAVAHRIQLAAFEVVDETRITPIETAKGLAVFKKGAALEVREVKDGRWELRPKKSLQPGEYLLAITPDDPVAAFTIVARGY